MPISNSETRDDSFDINAATGNKTVDLNDKGAKMRHLFFAILLLSAANALASETVRSNCGILLSEGDSFFSSGQAISALNAKGYSVSQVVLQSLSNAQ